MTLKTFSAIAILVLAGVPTVASAQTSPLDVTQWRGRNRDGAASGFVEPKTWPTELHQRWTLTIGEGYATPLVVGPRVFTIARRDGHEIMMALDAATGKVQWETSYPAPYKMNPATAGHGQGPKATPLFYDGKLFTLGISGIVSAFDATTGKLLWQKPAPPVDPTFGTSTSPVADGAHVIVYVGGNNQGALTAFNKDTGAVAWQWAGDGPAYGSPIVATFGGTKQIVTVSQEKFISVAADTGELLWERPLKTTYVNSAITPIQIGDAILISAQEKGIMLLRPVKGSRGWTPEVIWETSEAGLFMSNAVVVDGTLYGMSHLSSGQFFALDVKTGKVLWKTRGREGDNTAFVKSEKTLFLLKDSGELIVARPSTTAFEPLKSYTVAKSATYAQPAISGNRIFVKDVSALTLWTVD